MTVGRSRLGYREASKSRTADHARRSRTARGRQEGYVRSVRVLVTNDDGIESEGLHVLAQALTTVVSDVVVAAPAGDASGSSAALGVFHRDSRIDVKRVEVPGCDA